MRNYYLLLICLLSCSILAAQQPRQYTEKEYAHNPLWIQMTDDTTANYFEVQKAFIVYFKHHVMPEGEDEVIGRQEERRKFASRRALRRLSEQNLLAIDVKKYERWKARMLPYVRQDGSILYPYQRMQIWAAQQELLRRTDINKNK